MSRTGCSPRCGEPECSASRPPGSVGGGDDRGGGRGPGERTTDRLGYRAGYYSRGLVTRIGKLELWVPRDREGRFSTEFFDRYQRSEKALVSALSCVSVA